MNLSITSFLEPFFPDADEPVYLFGLDAKNIPDELRHRASYKKQTTRRELKENRALQSEIKKVNETRGLYFTVNAGGTKAEEITRINAVFAEIDDRPLDEQNDIFDNCVYPPSVRVETLRSIHAYWLMTKETTVEQFAAIQHGLIASLKSDPSIKNPNRLMRLPFFNHVSFDAGEYLYKPIAVRTFNSETRFTPEEMIEAFPFDMRGDEPAQMPRTVYAGQSQEEVMQELRWRIMQHSTYRKSGEWGSMQGVCHSGKSKTALGLNLRSGKVHCFFGCEYKTILAAFDLEFPEKKPYEPTKVKFVPRKQQSSETYKWLKGYVEIIQGDEYDADRQS